MSSKIQTLTSRLNDLYGIRAWSRWRDPVGELIRTILSQNTTDKNSLNAFAKLTEKYPVWEEILQADEEEIAETIRSGGLANIKAAKIKKNLQEIKKRQGKIDLEFLGGYSLNEAKEYLVSLDGVGPKTAACVLMFSFNIPYMPVDTHVHRVSNRIGIIDTKTREKSQEELNLIIPEKDRYDFHLNIIEHGRQICKAASPQCSECFLTDICDFYNQKQTK
ncbi:MAG: endonuclease III domain-containing protein [Candidatus Thorarchaeota archaeon]